MLKRELRITEKEFEWPPIQIWSKFKGQKPMHSIARNVIEIKPYFNPEIPQIINISIENVFIRVLPQILENQKTNLLSDWPSSIQGSHVI